MYRDITGKNKIQVKRNEQHNFNSFKKDKTE